jgi:hypothetical protein
VTDLQEYEQRLAAADQELARAQEAARLADDRLAQAGRHAEALRSIVSGLRQLEDFSRDPQKERLPVTNLGDSEPATEAEQPRGREAIRRVMRENPKPWKQRDLIAAIRDRGWIDPNAKQPDAAIRIAVRRLAEAGEIEKVPGMAGVYRLKDSSVTTLEEATRTASESTIATNGEV